ncbi:MAG: TonB-dependent receptor [Ignavibacteriae bacterium]|nr:TonB-dependent receptor [Ignavibacteria bacterium]MBI3363916.1 TonB-dependent receptor [Ignavibacteriota bacterium]
MVRIFIVCVLLCVTVAIGYGGNGKITGRVMDAQSKEPLIGATVLIVGTTMGSSTDVEGKFIILSVPTGEYKLKASYVGYNDQQITGIRVSSDLTTEINFSLTASGVELKAVEIVAEQPMVNKSSTNIVRIATREELEKLPLRGVINAVALQPGVVAQDDRGTQRLYIRGGRSDEVGYYVEGVPTRSILTGDNITNVIPEALEEFQVHAGGYTAEYGGANAGIVRQQLRSGTSTYRATLQLETDNLNVSKGFLQHTPGEKFLNTYNYGYSDYVLTLSGPLMSDRVKLFVAGENQFQRDTHVQFIEPFRFENLVDANSGRRDTVHVLEFSPGNVPGTMKNRYSVNGTLTFDFNPYIVRVGGTYSWQRSRVNDFPIVHIFNLERLPQTDQSDGLFNVKFTHFLSPKTFYEANLSYFDFRQKVYDPLLGDDYLHYKDSLLLSDLGFNTNLNYAQNPSTYNLNGFPFDRRGRLLAQYQKGKQYAIGASLDLTSQVSSHEIKIGGSFNRYSVRSFQLGRRPPRPNENDLENLLAAIRDDPNTFRTPGDYDLTTDSYARDISYLKAGAFISAYGYDVYGNEVNGGFDGPKHPTYGAFYLQDKLELSDLIIKAGLRLDIMDNDDNEFKSATNPDVTRSDLIIPGAITKKDAFKQVSPRIGFSLPVTDRTQFHVQYGKFIQAPQLNTLYAGRGYSAVIFSGQNFISQPIGYGLDPERATQYEIGFTQQFSDYAVFDITGFYKDIQGQIQLAKIVTDPGAVASAYNTLQNGDYATTKGVELHLGLRRVARIQAQANYTLSDAQGTGSSPYSAVAGVENGTPRPTVISPLTFNQTHRGTLNIDYRFNENDGPVLSRLGANILFSFNSGHNFTLSTGSIGQRDVYLGGILADDDPRTRKPIEPINSSTTPWNFSIDLRVDKSLRIGSFDLNVYLYAQNLLNTKNVINVYSRTGNAYDDGFLGNPDLSENIVRDRGQQYVEMYKAINLANRQHYELTQGGDLFGPPRQVRLGFRIEY